MLQGGPESGEFSKRQRQHAGKRGCRRQRISGQGRGNGSNKRLQQSINGFRGRQCRRETQFKQELGTGRTVGGSVVGFIKRKTAAKFHTTRVEIKVRDVLCRTFVSNEDAIVGVTIKFGITMARTSCSHEGAKHTQVGEIWFDAVPLFERGGIQS